MNNTLRDANDCMKLLDKDWFIRMWRNDDGLYVACCYKEGHQPVYVNDSCPSECLSRLTEKALGKKP